MRLYEIATQVKVTDNDRTYFYWVTVARPEKAKAAALKKHATTMYHHGVLPKHSITAEIVHREPSEKIVKDGGLLHNEAA